MLNSFNNPPPEYRLTSSQGCRATDGSVNHLSIEQIKADFDRCKASPLDLSYHDASSKLRPETDIQHPRAQPPACSPGYAEFSSYTARINYALAQGRYVAQAALLQAAQSCRTPYSQAYHEALIRSHLGYDVLDEPGLVGSCCVDQQLLTDGHSYELLIIPPLSAISYEAALKIMEFVEDGGMVIATNVLPEFDAHGDPSPQIRDIFFSLFGVDPTDPRQQAGASVVSRHRHETFFLRLKNPAELASHLHHVVCEAIKPEVSIRWHGSECDDILFHHRALNSGEIYFFANTANEARIVRLSIRCTKAPCVLNPETGQRTALPNCTQIGSRTLLLQEFERHGSMLISFDDHPSLAVPPPVPDEIYKRSLPGEWGCVSDGSGDATYRQTVMLPNLLPSQRAFIRVDNPSTTVEYFVNGRSAGLRAWPPFEVDVSRLVKPGLNDIELKLSHPCEFGDAGVMII